jgi:hypothetical protein
MELWRGTVRFVLVELGGLILHAVIAQFVNITHQGYFENRASFPTTSAPPGDPPEEVFQVQNRVAVSGSSLTADTTHLKQLARSRHISYTCDVCAKWAAHRSFAQNTARIR